MHYLLKEKVSSTGTIIPDKRGKSTPPNKISENTVNRVNEHIKLLPVTQSHYNRAKSHRRVYLPTASSILRLYAKYNEFMMEKYPGEPKVTEHVYRDVFTKQYNIGIVPPVVDTCATCDVTKGEIQRCQAQENDTTTLETKLRDHNRKSFEAHDLMPTLKNDRDPERRVICMDLQQTLPCPRLTTGMAFYKKEALGFQLLYP